MHADGIQVGSLFKQDAKSEYCHWVVGIDAVGALIVWGPRNPREYIKRPLAMMSYGMTSTDVLRQLQRVADVPLNERESKAHRPDLPLRMLRHPTVNWRELEGISLESSADLARGLGLDLSLEPPLDAPEIVLAVIPSSGGWRKATKFTASNGESFSPGEVLWRASQVFEMEGLAADDGIGIFRAGINKKVPFYLVGVYHDLAGVTYRFEHPDAPPQQPSEQWGVSRKKPTGDFVDRIKGFKAILPFTQ